MSFDWSGRRVAVVGLGKENTPLALFLAAHGARVTGVDQRPADRLPAAAQLAAAQIRVVGGTGDYLRILEQEPFDYIFLTPGMVKDLPPIVAARRRGAKVSTQVNLFFSLCPAPIIGVTGTSGKSTTTTLIGNLLSAAGKWPVYVGGNLGEPLIDRVEEITADSLVVLELSSFQLELAEASPHIAVLLNIYPNHLDIHPSLEAYQAAKENIFRFQRPEQSDMAIFYFDDPGIRSIAEKAPASRSFFGQSEGIVHGATVQDGWVVVKRHQREIAIMPLTEIRLPGPHNINNVLAAVNVAELLGVPVPVIRQTVAQFQGLEHRLEVVKEKNGILYVNDSIATTPDRAAAALRSFQRPVVLIAGGSDKGITFEQLAEAVLTAPVRALVLVGATADAIAEEVHCTAKKLGRPVPPIVITDNFDAAVLSAAERARSGDVLLLSPGCASYDMFPNFMERGKRFRQLISQL